MTTPTPFWSDQRPTLPIYTFVRVNWQARFFILKRTALFFLIGVLVAWLKQPEFQAEAQLMPEMNNGASNVLKKLSSVAGFTGIDLTELETSDAVRPDLYPNVLQSTPFVLFLIEQTVGTTTGQRQTVGQLLLSDQRIWPRLKQLVFSTRSSNKQGVTPAVTGPVRLSERQHLLVEDINDRVRAKFDTRSGIISIVATLPDAQAAADAAQLAMNYLTSYVTEYRTEKARQDVDFYTQQLAQAQQRHQKSQLMFFQYNDSHRALSLQAATVEQSRLETEWRLAQTLLAEIARQYEQAQIKVQERTPVFKVLEPPSVPLKRTPPGRFSIILLCTLIGTILTSVWIGVRQTGVGKHFQLVIADDT